MNYVQEHVLPLKDLIMLNSIVSSVRHRITLGYSPDILEHVLPLHDLTMLNLAVSLYNICSL